MNTEEIMKLADAYAAAYMSFSESKARAALEAALSAKQERISELEAKNAQLLGALIDIAYGLESARIWGGMDWTYNPLHPYKYLPLRDKARAAIAAVEGEV